MSTSASPTEVPELSPVRNRADAIRRELAQAERDWQSALGHAIRAGELLAEQKASLKHGEWLPWLAQHVPGLSDRMARNYMRVAENPELVAGLPTIRAAIAALAEPRQPQPKPGPETRSNRKRVADLPGAGSRARRVPTPTPRPEPESASTPAPEPEPELDGVVAARCPTCGTWACARCDALMHPKARGQGPDGGLCGSCALASTTPATAGRKEIPRWDQDSDRQRGR